MDEFLWQYVMQVNPFIKKEDILELKELNEWDLLIIFKNGRKIIFDRFTGYYREIFYDSLNDLTDEQEKKEFAYKLRQIMSRRHVTQEELAEGIKISQTMISHYMTGRCLPTAVVLRNIAKYLNCSMDDFFYKTF